MGHMVEFFEINLKECLLRLRWGKVLVMTEDEFGSDAAAIVQNILTHGKMKLPEMIEAMGATSDPARKAKLTSLVYRLLTSSHIVPTTPALLITPYDEINAKRKAAEKMAVGAQSAKELEALRQRVVDEIRTARLEEAAPERALIQGSSTTAAKKRKAATSTTVNGHDSSGKRSKNQVEDIAQIDPKACLRVNYEKYNVKIRNQLFTQAASDRWNKAAGGVLKAFLSSSIDKQVHVKQPHSGESLHSTLSPPASLFPYSLGPD